LERTAIEVRPVALDVDAMRAARLRGVLTASEDDLNETVSHG
jgi:hypothetical protein